MKRTKILVQTLVLLLAVSTTTAYAALPYDSIIIGNQAYSSDYVAEHTDDINFKIDNSKDDIYYVGQNNIIYNMFNSSSTVTESQLAAKNNLQITYYTKDKVQSYVARDVNSQFSLQGEYSTSTCSVEAGITVSGLGSYKSTTLTLRNLVGISNGKYFKLEDKADIKSINGTDSISIITTKSKEKVFILANDKKTCLAEGTLDFSSIQAGSLVLQLNIIRSASLNPDNITVTNKSGKTDTVDVTNLQPGAVVNVYDGTNSSQLLGKATAASNGAATIRNLDLNKTGGSIKLSQVSPSYVEGALITKTYGAELVGSLSTKPTFADPTGFENNNKTQIKFGSPSVSGNTFRYKMSVDHIAVPTVMDYATDWTPVSSGDLISDALNKYIGLAEVDSEGKIIRFTEGSAVVTNDSISKLVNGLKFVDVPGIDNNDKTQINLGEPSVNGNSFVYKVSSTSQVVLSPNYGDLLAEADGWRQVEDQDYITVTSGKHIGVAEIDNQGKAVQFSDAVAVVTNEGLPALTYGLKFIDVAGEANNGKTQIVLGSPSVLGNSFKYKISASSSAVPKPAYKGIIGSASGWQSVLPNDYITAANGKHIGVAEVNSNNEVIQFSDAVAVVVNESSAASISDVVLEYTVDEDGTKKVMFKLPQPSFPTNKYKYVASSDDSPVPNPNIGSRVASWADVADGDLKSIEYGKNVGVAEVDSGMKVIKFSNVMPAIASGKLAPSIASLSFSDAAGSYNNGKTKVSLPVPANGNTFKYIVSSNDKPVPTVLIGEDVSEWISTYDEDTISTDNGKNIGVAEVTSDGKVVAFSNAVAVVANDNRELVGGAISRPGTSYQTNGKTQINLGQPSISDNKFKYIISATNSAVATPAVGSSISSWAFVKDGDYITVADGKHIGVAEVDASNKVVAFSDVVARVENYAAPLVNSLSLSDVSGITNNGKVKVTLGTPSNVNNNFAYQIFSVIPTTNYKAATTVYGFTPLPEDYVISAKHGEYVGVAEVTSDNKLVQFSIVQNNFEDEKIAAEVIDGQSKLMSDNLSVNANDSFTIKVTKGTLKLGALTNNTSYTVSGLPAGINISAAAASDNTITFSLSGTLSSALTDDISIRITLTYSSITESGLDSSVNSLPIILTIKKN